MLTSAVVLGTAMAAAPWPDDADWVPIPLSGAALVDAGGDHAGVGDGSADLLAASWDATSTSLFLRLQTASSGAGVVQDWGWLVDLDGVSDDFELAILVQRAQGQLVIWENVLGADGLWVSGLTAVDVAGFGAIATGEVRWVDDTGDHYVDLQLPRATLDSSLGIGEATVMRMAAVSAVTWTLAWDDIAGCGAIVNPCTTLAGVLSDGFALDADGDGLSGAGEIRAGSDPTDEDTDDDGLDDADDAAMADAVLCDADGDGLLDGTEAGIQTPGSATDVTAGCFVADSDASTVTDPAAFDTDGGGLADGAEDHDRNGVIGPWETDPLLAGDDADADADGVPDVFDDLFGVGNDDDSDSDGLLDREEGFADTDGDGVPDFADDDSDGDGIADATDGLADPDEDGLPAFRDLDSDGDGLLDADEGPPHHLDTDSDGDGLEDGLEGLGDTDGDKVPDFLDKDSDGDGIDDEVERRRDTDRDGTRDFRDLDSDDDTVTDAEEGDDDTDGDGRADYRDLDSDDDGFLDIDEAGLDRDCDGLDDRIDGTTEDGFCDPGAGPPGPVGPGGDGGLEQAGNPLGQEGQFGGGACSTSPVAPLGWLAVLLLLSVARRADAQAVDAQRSRPSVDGREWVRVEEPRVTAGVGAGLWLDVASAPFVFRPDAEDAEPVDLLGGITTAHVVGYGAFGPVRLGAALPVHLFATGFGVDQPTHLGDVRLSAKVAAIEQEALQVGALVEVGLPSGDGRDWLGAGRARLTALGLVASQVGSVSVAGNVGARTGAASDVGSLRVSPALLWGAGGSFAWDGGWGLALELEGEHWLGNAGQAGAHPVEAMLSGRRRLSVGALTVGVGRGLTAGLGAPEVRIMVGIRVDNQGPREALGSDG